MGISLTGNSGHIDVALSNYAVMAFDTGVDGMVGGLITPAVPVARQSDKYHILEPRPFFTDEANMARRAPRTQAARVEFQTSSDQFFCDNYALASEFGYEEKANLDAVIANNLGMARAKLLTDKLNRAQEIRLANIFTSISNIGSGVVLSATTGTAWNDYVRSDPIGDVDSGQAFIQAKTGLVANTLVMDWNTRAVLRRHPLLLDLYKFTAGGTVSDEGIAKAFNVERILVAKAVKENRKEGTNTSSMTSIWGNTAVLLYVPPGNLGSFENPAAAVTRFQWADNGIYPANFGVLTADYNLAGQPHMEVMECGHFQAEKVTAKNFAYGFTTTLG